MAEWISFDDELVGIIEMCYGYYEFNRTFLIIDIIVI